jgi:hypothetical protein
MRFLWPSSESEPSIARVVWEWTFTCETTKARRVVASMSGIRHVRFYLWGGAEALSVFDDVTFA